MGTITLPNFRTTADVTMNTRLKDGGVAIDWAGLSNIKAWLYSDAQKAIAGRCDVSIDQTDNTKLVCEYSATKPQYLGVQRLIIQAKYMGRTKTYDKPVFNFVPRTADQEGTQIVIDDPEVDVEIDVEDISSSLIERLIAACIKATEEALDVVDVHRGPQGLSAYEVAVQDGYEGTEEQWIASLKGEDGDPGTTPHIGQNGNWFIGDVDTGVAAEGQNGVTPHIGQNGDWFIGETDTGVLARGTNGVTPHIGDNGHWFIGDTDTNVVAEGQDGEDGADGSPGITPHIGANNHWFIGETDTGILAEGTDGVTPDISIGTVTTVEPGTPAAASMGGTPEAPVLNLSIPKGLVGATPNITVGTVTTGQPGTPVVVTITGTPEAPVLNVTIPQGLQGNTGSSVEYPYELVNNLTTNDATKGLSAQQGVVLDGKISQLEHKLPVLGGYLVPLLRKVVYKDDDAESLINGINALLNTIELTSITAVYTQPGTIYAGQPLNDLKNGLVVTANYNDGTSVEVNDYELSGTLTAGTSSIVVTYQEKTTTFNVTVTDAVYYKDGSIFPGQVGLRNEITTSAGLSASYVKDGVSYVFASGYANGGNATTQKRSCYYLFDLLVTPGKQYKYIVEFNSAPTASQTIQWSNAYYDETYRVAGVANAYQTQNYSSNVQATSWAAATKDGNTISFSDTAPSGYVGVRISLKCVVSGSDAAWPTALSVKRLIIQEVE